MLWIGVHLPALSLESFVATLAPEPPAGEEDSNNIDELRRQMKEMQDRLDRMSKEPKKEE